MIFFLIKFMVRNGPIKNQLKMNIFLKIINNGRC